MIQKILAPISLTLQYDHHTKKTEIIGVLWEGRQYPIVKLGLHHTYRQGRTLYHVFSVAGQTLFFKLVLNTDTLHWTLEEIADDLTN